MTITPRECEWAAAFLEGEGTFYHGRRATGGARVCATQVQLWPLERLRRVFGGSLVVRPSKHKNWQPATEWRVNGHRAIGVMMTLYSLMSPGRQEQIRSALGEWRRRRVYQRYRTTCRLGHPLTKRPPYNGSTPGARWCRPCFIATTTRCEKIRDAKKRDELKAAGLYRAPGRPTREEEKRKRETAWVAFRRNLLWQNKHLTGRTTRVWFRTA